MQPDDVHSAKTQLSMLVEIAAKEESFIISIDDRSLVQVTTLNQLSSQGWRFGFMAGQIKVPDDFDAIGSTEIQTMFGC